MILSLILTRSELHLRRNNVLFQQPLCSLLIPRYKYIVCLPVKDGPRWVPKGNGVVLR